MTARPCAPVAPMTRMSFFAVEDISEESFTRRSDEQCGCVKLIGLAYILAQSVSYRMALMHDYLTESANETASAEVSAPCIGRGKALASRMTGA
jgi:hypothetical protein